MQVGKIMNIQTSQGIYGVKVFEGEERILESYPMC